MSINDQLQKALSDIINRTANSVGEGVSAGVQFLSDQLPDVIQQLLIWKFAQSAIPMFVALAVMIVALWQTWRCSQKLIQTVSEYNSHEYWQAERRKDGAYQDYMDAMGDDENRARYAAYTAAMKALNRMDRPKKPVPSFGLVISAVIAFLATPVFLMLSNLTWLQILIAPKIYLIEYAAALAK